MVKTINIWRGGLWPCVTHILGKSQDPNRWQVNHWPIRKKSSSPRLDYQWLLEKPSNFVGYRLSIVWGLDQALQQIWKYNSANIQDGKKHVGLNTTQRNITYVILHMTNWKVDLGNILSYCCFKCSFLPLITERKMRQMSVSILKGYLTIHTIPCVTGMPTEESANGRWNKHSIWCWLTSTAIF